MTTTYRFDRHERLGPATRRIAGELLDDALERLDAFSAPDAAVTTEFETEVHEVRKRTKELRGLLRLVRPALGETATAARRQAAAAARELAGIRDAHALVDTLDDLANAATAATDHDSLARVRTGQAEVAATNDAGSAVERARSARELLADVRAGVDGWRVPDRFGSIAGGLRRTYRDGRRAMRAAAAAPDDEALHEWRTRVKALWYQVRLLEHAAPSVLEPLAEALGDLADALGDDHDLAVLVESLAAAPERYGGAATAAVAADLARQEQDELRRRAFRLGARLYAEGPTAFTQRMRAYWRADRRVGRELKTGGLDVLARPAQPAAVGPASTVERERKFLVAELPDVDGGGDALRQGYLALDGDVAVRVREGRDGAVLTIKGGTGRSRTEVEWPLSDAQFEALWPLAAPRWIEKVRHRIPLGPPHDGCVAELDVFGGALDGLAVVEVEFDDDATMATFEPPAWFGDEVTDDPRYANAALAVAGTPPPA